MRLLLLFLCLCPLSNSYTQNTQIQYLSGLDKDQRVDWEFRIDNGMRAGEWTTIPVPSNWELEGFGVYNYGRGDNPPSDETGEYRYRFDVPDDWEGQVVHIVFEGSMTDTEVRINGQSAGPVHQGSFYRFKYDISKLLKYGEDNLLEATVRNWSANASVNAAEREADFWIFGGIFRPVYLEALPVEHIDWAAIDARADGSFLARLHLNNIGEADRLRASLQTLEGENVGQPVEVALSTGQDTARLQTRVEAPQLWSPEFPHRYRVNFELLEGGEPIHRTTETFGFRTVELRPGDGIYVNGVRVLFKGVNRHSAWPESGRTTSRALSLQDVELMKDMNMNAVRMSHYPPDKHFLEVCDSLGLFVIDELTGWQAHYDTEVGEKLVRELVIDDVNHPSIIMWANGNEGGFNLDLDDDFHLYDIQRRPVIHPWAIYGGTDTHHYIDFDCCAGAAFHSDDIFFPTEFLHGLYDGGLGAGLEDYWRAMMEQPNAAGGFLWVFADEGVIRTDKNGMLDTWGSNAPDGIVGPFREKEGSFFTIREIWNPVQISPPAGPESFRGRLRVKNQYLYTNLKDCSLTYSWLRFPGPLEEGQAEILSRFSASGPDLPPGEEGWLEIAELRDYRSVHALQVEIHDPHGRPVFTYVFPFHDPEGIHDGLAPRFGPPATMQETADKLWMRSGEAAFRIDKASGMLDSVTFRGSPLSLSQGPSLDAHVGQYVLQSLQLKDDSPQPEATFRFIPESEAGGRGAPYTVTYTMMPDGWLRMDCAYRPVSGTYDFLGINFSYPEEKMLGVRWLGRGPYRVWKNRMKGPQLGVWEKAYNNTVTGESGWAYPEFKGYHADLHWAVIETDEGPFVLATETPGLFLRLYTPNPPQGAYNDHTDGIFPAGDISIMHAISPIGTKFKSADRLGPMGRPHQVNPFADKVTFRARLYLRPIAPAEED